MSKTRFYLIRHGETVWNKEKRYQGWTDIELSEKGKKQAELLGKRFQNLKINAVYSSPLKRAVKTAQPIADTANLPVIIDEHFKEINFGAWEGGTVEELTQQYGKEFSDFFESPFEYPFPGEGSFAHVAERSLKGFQLLLEKHKGQSVVIVSHGGLLRVLMIKLMGMDISFYRKTWLNNTSITTIDMIDGNPLLYTLNDSAHIETIKK